MRKRRFRLVLLAVALIGVVTWFLWPTTPGDIAAVKRTYARLQLGMSEGDMTAILGSPPRYRYQLIGEWINDGYKLTAPLKNLKPGPHENLYDRLWWVFGDQGVPRPSQHFIHIWTLFDHDRLIEIDYNEWQDNTAKMWLRELGRRLSINMPFLNDFVGRDYQAIPPP